MYREKIYRMCIYIIFRVSSHHFLLSKVFNTSLAEPAPAGYEDVSNIVPPYSAYSAKGRPEVSAGVSAVRKNIIGKISLCSGL